MMADWFQSINLPMMVGVLTVQGTALGAKYFTDLTDANHGCQSESKIAKCGCLCNIFFLSRVLSSFCLNCQVSLGIIYFEIFQ